MPIPVKKFFYLVEILFAMITIIIYLQSASYNYSITSNKQCLHDFQILSKFYLTVNC